MEYIEDVVTILSKLNLDDIEQTISKSYNKQCAGRPPRNPLRIFKPLNIKQLRALWRLFGWVGHERLVLFDRFSDRGYIKDVI